MQSFVVLQRAIAVLNVSIVDGKRMVLSADKEWGDCVLHDTVTGRGDNRRILTEELL